ncbi:murein hydrolase activator EnvC [Jiella sp. M17.18]|uniref:murein hydrolase activator EnvC family protein n=1 Tax=Jiella sp. M17.18 TaxID=3234247 RepID=UPI0034DE8BFD
MPATASPVVQAAAVAAPPTDGAGLDPIKVGALDPGSIDLIERERAKTEADLADVSSRISLSREKIRSLDAQIASIAADRDRLRQAMIDAADKQKTISQQLTATEGRIDDLAVEEGKIKASLHKRRGVLMEVLAALERMGRTPPPALLVKPQDALGSVRSAILLGAVVPSLRKETETLLADLDRLSTVKDQILKEKATFADQLTRHREEEARLSKLFAEKAKLEADSRGERVTETARAAELASKASNLKDLIAGLQSDLDAARAREAAARAAAEQQRIAEEQAQAEAARQAAEQAAKAKEQAASPGGGKPAQGSPDTSVAVAEAEPAASGTSAGGPKKPVAPGEEAVADAADPRSAAPADAAPADAAASGPTTAPGKAGRHADAPAAAGADATPDNPSQGSVEVAALEPPTASAPAKQAFDIASLRRETAELEPAAPFSTMKGRLSKPVAGKKIIGFGDTDDIGRVTTGESYATRPGDVVTAPADARVLYSGPFRSYGQVLILDAGDGYHVVLAGMERIDVESGQFVSAGEPVALMGARRIASVQVAEFGASEPALYVEFRKDGKPVDPSPWWMDEPSGRTRNDS